MKDSESAGLELQALKRVSELVASSLSLDEVIAACLDINVKLANAVGGAVYLVEAATGDFRRARCHNLPEIVVHDRYPRSAMVAALERDGAVFSAISAYEYGDEWRQAIAARGIQSVLVLALRSAGKLVGCMSLLFQTLEAPTQSTLETIMAVAVSQAAAIQNAGTREELERRADLALRLHEFAKHALKAATESELYELGVKAGAELTQADGTFIAVRDHEWIACVARRGPEAPELGVRAPLEKLGVDWQRSQIRSETGVRVPLTYASAPVAFVWCVLRAGEKPLGIICSQRKDATAAFSAAQIEAFETMGAMLSQALERVAYHEEAVARSLRITKILENLPMSVVVLERSGRIAHANADAIELMAAHTLDRDMSWKEIVRQLDVALPDGTRVKPTENPVHLAFDNVATPPSEYGIIFPVGTKKRTALLSAIPLTRGNKVDEVLVVLQDISPLRALTEERERFLSIAAHELRAPITPRCAAPAPRCNSIRRRCSTTTSASDSSRRLDRPNASHRASSSRSCSNARDSAAISCRSRSSAAIWSRCATKRSRSATNGDHSRVRFEAETEVQGVWDHDRLEQVVVNLLSNALRYGEPNAAVMLRLRADSANVELSVTDHGPGIDPAHQQLLFSPFFSLARRARAQQDRRRPRPLRVVDHRAASRRCD